MQQLLFCRHGQSQLNAAHIYAGQLNTPLTDIGREQARIAGEKAKTLGIDVIIASPLDRTRETAQLVADGFGYPHDQILFDEVFIERSYGTLEGQPWSTENAMEFDGIESEEALQERAARGLEVLKALEQETVLLVGHGAFARALIQVLGLPAGDEPANADIIKLI